MKLNSELNSIPYSKVSFESPPKSLNSPSPSATPGLNAKYNDWVVKMKDWTMGIQTPESVHDKMDFSEIQRLKKSSLAHHGSSKEIYSPRSNSFQQKLVKYNSESHKALCMVKSRKEDSSRIMQLKMNSPMEFTQRLKRKDRSYSDLEHQDFTDQVNTSRARTDEILFFNDDVQEIYESEYFH